MVTTVDHLLGCTIYEKCMLHPDGGLVRRDSFCENDLKCVCKVDNRLAHNSLFSNDCLLKECPDGHDRKLFLRNWLESCRQVGRSGWDDLPQDWVPYLPDGVEEPVGSTGWINMPSTTASSRKQTSAQLFTSTAAVATSLPVTFISTLSTATSGTLSVAPNMSTSPSSEATSATPQPTIVTSGSFSPGVIGGIITSILLLALLCAGLGFFYWRSKRKVTKKNKEVAILTDRVSGCGFQKRIDELLAGSNSSTETILRPSALAPAEMTRISSSTGGLTSTSSSMYSIDVARII